jgi:predicted ribosomally synthesized peptide with SipW-like signal peptide
MTDDTQLYNLSRRKLLAGLGTVGLASAGAGLGTSAFFSDRESFTNNSLRAGELDLLVDWQQTYDGPAESAVYGSAGRPYVNAYPDSDGDGVQDDVPQSFVVWAKRNGYDLNTAAGQSAAVAAFKDAFFADLGEGNDWEAPLVALEDVKPGDTGEVTLSLHLFDNPAYIRMLGDLTGEAENGLTEPEAEVDSTPDTGELGENVDVVVWNDDGDNAYEPRNGQDVDVVVLFDTSCSMEWADSSAGCNANDNTPAPNKFPQAQAGAKALFEELLAEPDISGLGLPADMVPDANVRVGLVEYGNDTGVKVPLGDDLDALRDEVDGMSPGNSTLLPTALEEAIDMLGGSDADEKCVVVIGDGQPHDEPNNEPGSGSPVSPLSGVTYDDWGATYSVQLTEYLEDVVGANVLTVHYEVEPEVSLATGIDTAYAQSTAPGYDIVDGEIQTIELFEIMASPVSGDPLDVNRLSFAADRDRLVCVLHRIAHLCAGEVPLFYGSLDGALDALDDGLLLVGNPRVAADPEIDAPARECLEWSCTYYVGFEWAVDPAVGNEIQSDSLEFSLGFEAEQCRHNEEPFESEDAEPAGQEVTQTAD